MPTYAFAHLQTVDFNAEIVEYINRIDATLEPYHGRFLIHGRTPTVVDGEFTGVLVAIEFPDRERATRLVRVAGIPGDPAAAHPQLHRQRLPRRRRRARLPRRVVRRQSEEIAAARPP